MATLDRAAHTRLQWLVASAGLLVLLALLTEAFGAALCYIQTGRIVYFAAPSAEVAAPARTNDYKQRLHPYFGFTGQYGAEWQGMHNNELGFLQREPLSVPYPAAPNDFVVAVFGGSVAQHVVLGLGGAPSLRDVLRKLAPLTDKNVVVIDMAQGSGKQPQQLLELAYLLAAGQRIDCVVNLDGFNEFALGYQSYLADVHPILPAVQIMRPLALTLSAGAASAEYYDLAGRVLSARNAVAANSTWLSQARTGLGYFTASVLVQWNKRLLAGSLHKYEEHIVRSRHWSDLKGMLSLDLPPPKSDIFETIFDLWLRSSQQMKALAEVNRAAYLHVIQPNQFYSKHSFSDRERAVALAPPADHEYRVGIAGGYRLLDERRSLLETNGIVSAIDLFDAEPGEVYADSCCHYTGRGLTLFVRLVADEIGRRIK